MGDLRENLFADAGVRGESGAIMVEGLIVYGVTMILLFFVLAIFCILYQYWNVQVIADETAARVAQTYKLQTSDIVTGSIQMSDLSTIRPYRYRDEAAQYEASARLRAVEYATDRLSKTTFTQNVSEPVISVRVEKDGIARRHLVVDITGSYKVPFGEALDFFGLHGTTTYDVVAYAECLDFSDYIGTVSFIGNKAGLGDLDSKAVKAADQVLKLIKNLKK